MKVLVTGSNGFIGKNIIYALQNINGMDIYEWDKDTDTDTYHLYLKECDMIIHCAGINRSENEIAFYEGNTLYTKNIIDKLVAYKNIVPIIFTSSIQANQDNPYGKSKLEAEQYLTEYGNKYKVNVTIFRLPNVFGKWCRPFYNNVVATFCYQLTHNIPLTIHHKDSVVQLVYIDVVVKALIEALYNKSSKASFGKINENEIYSISIGELAQKLQAFNDIRKTQIIPEYKSAFDRYLHATFLTHIDKDKFTYPLDCKVDNRGELAEIIKMESFGQMFISRTKPGITRGNHYHHTKIEKFLVVSGIAKVVFRKIDGNEVVEYFVNGNKWEIIDIIPGYTHAITNIGDDELITLFWANEIFDSNNPDTYFLEVYQ